MTLVRGRTWPMAILLAAALIVAGCKSSSSSPGNGSTRPADLCCASGVDLALTRDALQKLIERAIEKPTSDRLLGGAWDGLIANVRSQGVHTGNADKPAFTGDAKADFAAFSAGADALVANHRGKLDTAALNYAAIDSMAQSLDDSHITFLPPDAAKRQNTRDAGNLGTTTGLRLERSTEHAPVVLEVIPDSAADQAGIRPGDTVYTLNGRKVESFSPRELGRALEGADGSRLTLGIHHANSARMQQLTLIRRTIALDLVRSKILPGNVGYIRIREFPGSVPIQLQVRQAVGDFDSANTNGIIIDLRGNPGGSLGVLQVITSEFVSQSPIAYVVPRDGRPQPIDRVGPFNFHQKLVVLIDRGSASSSEVLAAAVQEYGDGVLIGEQSCGCLMGALFAPLLDKKSALEIAIERVLTPVTKQEIEKHGLVPDTTVTADPKLLGQGRDPQLEAALIALGVEERVARTATLAVEQSQP